MMKEMTRQFLDDVYDAVSSKKVSKKQLESLIQNLPAFLDPEEFTSGITLNSWDQVISRRKQKERIRQNQKKTLRIIVLTVSTILILGTLSYFIYNSNRDLIHQVFRTYTPTITVTPTPTSTATITPSPAFTATPTPTMTSIPESIFLISDLSIIYPRIPIKADSVWILDETQAKVDPPLDSNNIWSLAKSIDPENIEETYYYTETGKVTIRWKLDQPLNHGLYGIYVLDTVEHSSGSQQFSVYLDSEIVDPYRGQNSVIFGNKPNQVTDDWLLLGFFDVSQGQSLKIEASVDERTSETPFAIDRILIAKLTDEHRTLLDGLPGERTLVNLLDDSRGFFYSGENQLRLNKLYQGVEWSDALAWGQSFRSFDITGENWDTNAFGNRLRVDWTPIGRISQGKYELYTWIPAEHATAVVEFALLSDNEVINRENPAKLNQRDHSSKWVSLGIWELPRDSSVTIRMIINKEDNLAEFTEIGIDAVALVKVNE